MIPGRQAAAEIVVDIAVEAEAADQAGGELALAITLGLLLTGRVMRAHGNPFLKIVKTS